MNNPTITRIDHDGPLSQAALLAEERLFGHLGLQYRVRFLELDDPKLRVRVLDVGQGPPLLMVPGGSGDACFFAPLIQQLEGWRVIAINRPGGGMSDGIDHRDIDVRRLAVTTLRTVADAFELDTVPIVCNSMGGLWSFWYTLEFPDRVASMVQLGCPALILETSAPLFMRLLGVQRISGFIANGMIPKRIETTLDGLRLQGSTKEDIARMPRVAAEAAYHFFHLPTYLDTWKTLISAVATLRGSNPTYQLRAGELQQVEQPVQFVWGNKDPFGGLKVAREVVGLMPNAALHEMKTGHLPFLDKPEECGRVVREFLEK